MMRRLLATLLTLWTIPAAASDCWDNVGTTQADCGVINMYLNGSSQAVAVAPSTPLPVIHTTLLPNAATAISGNSTGTTGAVVGTLSGTSGKTTYLCQFDVQAIGGTAAVGPITVAGLVGSSRVYQGSSSAAGGTVASASFNPCIPASAANTAITITTTADGTASAVDVNSWGYQQ
jgi:hypothetical protein